MKLQGIKHRFGNLEVIKDISITIGKGEIVSIIGQSGCGKTTLLKILAGFIVPSSLDAFDSDYQEIPNSNVVYVSQKQLLFPWMTVEENIRFGLKSILSNKKQTEQKLKKLIELVGLSGFDNFYPNQLSGGMQQRAALARAISVNPKYLLLDEPFSALDDVSRMLLENQLLVIQKRTNISIVLVTHDLEEAIYLSNRVLILSSRPSKILQELAIEIPFPREDELRNSEKFLYYKKSLLNKLK